MADTYDGNSHKMKEAGLVRTNSSLNQTPEPAKEQEHKSEKIVKGTVKTRKKTFGHKVAKAIFAEELPDVKEHVIWDVMIPGVRDGIRNALINIVESIFGGGIRGNRSGGTRVSYRNGGTDYNHAYGGGVRAQRSEGLYAFEDVIFDNRGEAEAVKDQLQYNIERYGYVSVLDYYDMCGLRTRPSDANFGWTNLKNATVDRVSGGYLLRLPDVMPIER